MALRPGDGKSYGVEDVRGEGDVAGEAVNEGVVGDSIGSGMGVMVGEAARVETMLFDAFIARMPDNSISTRPATNVIVLSILIRF
jgi:hypothetical protein